MTLFHLPAPLRILLLDLLLLFPLLSFLEGARKRVSLSLSPPFYQRGEITDLSAFLRSDSSEDEEELDSIDKYPVRLVLFDTRDALERGTYAAGEMNAPASNA